MNVPMWNNGPELRNTYCASIPDHGAMSRPCAINARDGQHRRVGPAVERGGVDEQERRVGGRVGVGIGRAPGRDELLVLAPPRPARVGTRPSASCRIQRPACVAPARPARTVGPTSSSCQTTTAGARSSMTKASSSGCWRQFAGQNIAPISQQASNSSWMRKEFCPNHSTRSPAPTPAARSAFAARWTRVAAAPPIEGHRRRRRTHARRAGCGRGCAARRRGIGGRSPSGESNGTRNRNRAPKSAPDRYPLNCFSESARPVCPPGLRSRCCPPASLCFLALPARLAWLPCRPGLPARVPCRPCLPCLTALVRRGFLASACLPCRPYLPCPPLP